MPAGSCYVGAYGPRHNEDRRAEDPGRVSMLDVNEYFDGKVKSIGFQTETLRATVGVMAPGNYE